MTIGLGVVSYNRPLYLEQCLYNLDKNSWGGADVKVIVIDEVFDGAKYGFLHDYQAKNPDVYIWFQENGGVGKAKNQVIRMLLARDVTDIFVMEDDITMESPITCNLYCQAAYEAGIHHLNFALHGPMNKGKGKLLKWHGKGVVVYPDCVGAFSYYTRECIEKVGLIDENFKNAWEHVEHTYRVAEAGMTPTFWYFADCPGSEHLLSEIPESIDNSSIRPRPDWAENIRKGQNYWIKKHGKFLPHKPMW